MKQYIFACVHNAGRSQMAAAWFNHLVDPRKARALSAGTQPGSRVHPQVVQVMGEAGLDLSSAVPRRLTAELARQAGFVVTMGCGETVPEVEGLAREDWPIEDPKDESLERVRWIRDRVRAEVAALVERERLS